MPKSYAHGDPSYAGHVDVSSPDTDHPEWVPASEVDDVTPEREDKPAKTSESKPAVKRDDDKRPTPRKR